MSGGSPEPAYTSQQFDEYMILFEGASVACILTGIYLAIAVINIHLLLLRKKRYKILLLYTIVQLALTMLDVTLARIYNTPHRGLAIFNISDSSGLTSLSTIPDVIADTALILNLWISDAFLLYRCYVACLGNKYALVLPALLYLATVSSSLAWLAVSSIPGAVYSTHAVRVTAICYWSLSTALNIYASCLISVRFWMHRRAICDALGPGQGVFYLYYIWMTLESALLYTVFAIVALVVFTLNSTLEFIFIPALGVIQAVAPSLIIHRIARGISFGVDRYETTTTDSIHFERPNRPQTITQPVHQDIPEYPGVTLACSIDSADTHLYASNSFIRKNQHRV